MNEKSVRSMKNNRKLMFIIYVFILLILAVSCIVVIVQNSNLKHSINNEKKHINVIKDCSNKKDTLDKNENIIFFGDSITEFYKIDEIYDNYQITGSGKSGYTTEDLLDNMENMLYKYNPTKVILLIGTNDIMTDVSEKQQKETINNIKKICSEISKNRPDCKIYVESIYPVNKDLDSNMVNKRTNSAIKNINKEVKKYCEEKKLTYIDIYDELTDKDGNFDKAYSDDGLHPTDLGYAKISTLLTKYIYE